jgi:hypothetical protein
VCCSSRRTRRGSPTKRRIRRFAPILSADVGRPTQPLSSDTETYMPRKTAPRRHTPRRPASREPLLKENSSWRPWTDRPPLARRTNG